MQVDERFDLKIIAFFERFDLKIIAFFAWRNLVQATIVSAAVYYGYVWLEWKFSPCRSFRSP